MTGVTQNTATSQTYERLLLDVFDLPGLNEQSKEKTALQGLLINTASFFEADYIFILKKYNDKKTVFPNISLSCSDNQTDFDITVENPIIANAIDTNHSIIVNDLTHHHKFNLNPTIRRYTIDTIAVMVEHPSLIIGLASHEHTSWDENTLNQLKILITLLSQQSAPNPEISWPQQHNYQQGGYAIVELAHLAKNILQMVGGASEVMELALEKKMYDRIDKSWTIFSPNFQRLKRFILDLVKYTKNYPLQTGPCNVNELTQKAVESLKPQLARHKLKVTIKLSKSLPAAILDAGKVQDIITNLTINAIDNAPTDTGQIHIETQYIDHRITITVTDNGETLDHQLHETMFLPAERGRENCGTGLDLPLVKKHAEQHGGRVWIDPNTPTGNTFVVELPI